MSIRGDNSHIFRWQQHWKHLVINNLQEFFRTNSFPSTLRVLSSPFIQLWIRKCTPHQEKFSVMLSSFTIIFCTKHMAFPILLSTRLWEEVSSFYSLHECSFIQAALLSAFLSGRSQTWRNLKHQKLEMRTSRNQTASPFVFRSTSALGGQKQHRKGDTNNGWTAC